MIKNTTPYNPFPYEKYEDDKDFSSRSYSFLDISTVVMKIIGKENQSNESGLDRRCGDMNPDKSGIRNFVDKKI